MLPGGGEVPGTGTTTITRPEAESRGVLVFTDRSCH